MNKKLFFILMCASFTFSLTAGIACASGAKEESNLLGFFQKEKEQGSNLLNSSRERKKRSFLDPRKKTWQIDLVKGAVYLDLVEKETGNEGKENNELTQEIKNKIKNLKKYWRNEMPTMSQ